MKRIMSILMLVVPLPFLWAQQGAALTYDKITTESRFKYSWGLRYSSESTDLEIGVERNNSGYSSRGPNQFRSMTSNGYSLFYQAGWKYFMLDIAPSIFSVSGLDFPRTYLGLSVQPALVFPLTDFLFSDPQFHVAFFVGPQLILRNRVGIYGVGGIDLGFAATKHHIVFLQVSGGGGDSGGASHDDFDMGPQEWVTDVWSHSAWKFQVTLGVKTRVMDDVFYLEGKEIGRKRKL